jgi:hypothetical protein
MRMGVWLSAHLLYAPQKPVSRAGRKYAQITFCATRALHLIAVGIPLNTNQTVARAIQQRMTVRLTFAQH